MRIAFKKNGGNVLFATLVTTGLIGLYLASYLTMVRRENHFTTRSQVWNGAIPVAEAGIEEAMTHLKAVHTNLNDLDTEDWHLVDGKFYMKTNWLNADAYYIVGIFPQAEPVIVSEGFARLPDKTNFVSRTVQVAAKRNMLFPYGMLADQSVQLNGRNILIDSFDSGDENYSTGGRYDPSKRKDNGTLVTNSKQPGQFDLGNARIYGTIASGEGGGWEDSPNLTVGDNAWHAAKKKGIQPGAYTDDVNVSTIEVECLFDSGLIPPLDEENNYKYVLGSAEYCLSAPLKFEGDILVTGNAKLLITDDFDFKDKITIQSNASLTLYMAGKSAKIGGQGVQNDTGIAANFVYYGLPSNEEFTFSGNGEFVGCVYAPNAVFTLSGGGQSEGDFTGASVTKTVAMNGQYEFHYDERLAIAGPSDGYIATSWDELELTWSQIRSQNVAAADLR